MTFGDSLRCRGAAIGALFAVAVASTAGCAGGAQERGVIVATPPAAAPLLPSQREKGRDVYRLTFAGGEPALVAIAAPELAAFKLSVSDAAGRPVCEPVRQEGRIVCEWWPSADQLVVVEVHNGSRLELAYRLWTN